MSQRKSHYQLAVFTANISHFEAPFYRAMAENEALDLTVYYYDDIGLVPRYDSLYGKVIDWGVPISEGFQSKYLRHPISIVPELLLRRYDALILYGYRSWAHIAALSISKLAGTRLIFRGTGTTLDHRPALKEATRKVLLPMLVSQFDAVLVGGKSNVDYYRDLGVSDRKMHFVPFSVDVQFFAAQCNSLRPEKAAVKKRLLLEDKTIVLFVGNFTKKKGPDVFLRAAEICLGRHSDVTFVLAGDGPLRNELQNYIVTHDLTSGVRLLGFVPQRSLPEIYAVADLVVFPSLYFETWARAVNEAMACALPIVATRKVGAVEDLVEHRINGLIVDEADPVALADAVCELLNSPEKRQTMGIASRAKISTWDYSMHIGAVLDALAT